MAPVAPDQFPVADLLRAASPQPLNPDARVLSDAQLADLASRQATYATRDGLAFLVDPQGKMQQVPEASAPELLAQGWTSADPLVAEGALQQQRIAAQTDPWESFLQRAASASMMGLPDIKQRDMGTAGITAAQIAANPTASTLGSIAGTAAGMLAPGAPLSLASKGAAGLGELAAAGLGRKIAGRALPAFLQKAGGAAVRAGAEGATIGLGQGLSAIGLGADPEGEKLSEAILHGAATGALVGGGLSLAGSGLARLKALKVSRIANAESGFPAAQKRVADIEQDIATLKTPERAQAMQQAAQLEQTAADLSRRADLLKGSNDFNRLASAKNLRALADEASGQAKTLREGLDAAATRTGIKPSELEESLLRARMDMEGAALRKADAAAAAESRLPILDPTDIAKGGAALYAASLHPIAAVAAVGSKRILTSLLPAIRPAIEHAEAFGAAVGRAAEKVAPKVASPLRGAPAVLMTEPDFEKEKNRLLSEDDNEFAQRQAQLQERMMSLIGGTQEDAQTATIRAVLERSFLKEKLPKAATPDTSLKGIMRRKMPVSANERIRFGKYSMVIRNPSLLLDQISQLNVAPESIEAWQRVYPDALESLRRLIEQSIRDNAARGSYSRDQIRTVEAILGRPPGSSLANTVQSIHSTPPPAETKKTTGIPSLSPQMPSLGQSATQWSSP